MSSSSSQNEFSHRQGSITSLPDEDDQATIASDSFLTQQNLLSTINEYAKVSNIEDDIQNISEENPNGKRLSRQSSNNDQNRSRSNSTDDLTTSFGFQQQQPEQIDNSSKEINSKIDYESLIRSQKLYYDPNPELIRKPQMITPIVYKQNIMVKFLKPPPIPLGPLIIREVRPPQPPPPPPLVIRQRPQRPLSPPPIILREKPPQVPAILSTQVFTKTLPPIPPPPRSVIIEKLPPLPPKPRDIVIERWIPYESTTYKRKVIVERAEELKPYPPPRNIIITYDKVEAKIIREFQRHGVTSEDPTNYSTRYGNSLLDTKDLLAKVKELGINEDISLPNIINHELDEHLKLNTTEQNISYENKSENENKIVYNNNIDNHNYAPTFENLINGSSIINYNDLNIDHENIGEDLSAQLAQYGLTIDSMPY